jgi:hypothetical protein
MNFNTKNYEIGLGHPTANSMNINKNQFFDIIEKEVLKGYEGNGYCPPQNSGSTNEVAPFNIYFVGLTGIGAITIVRQALGHDLEVRIKEKSIRVESKVVMNGINDKKALKLYDKFKKSSLGQYITVSTFEGTDIKR